MHDGDQETAVQASMETIGLEKEQILTEVTPYSGFTLAEDYHQKYRLRGKRDLLGDLLQFYDSAELIQSTAAARINGYLAGYGTREQLMGEIDHLGLSETSTAVLLALPLPEGSEESGSLGSCHTSYGQVDKSP